MTRFANEAPPRDTPVAPLRAWIGPLILLIVVALFVVAACAGGPAARPARAARRRRRRRPQPRSRSTPAQPGADPISLLAWLFTPLFQAMFFILVASSLLD